MGKYSKLIGTVVGGLFGALVTFGIMPEEMNTPQLQAAIITIASAIGAFFAPKNKDA